MCAAFFMDRLTLIQRAQARIGDEPLASEADAGADTYVAIYDAKVEELLSRYPWTFATNIAKLSRLQAVPDIHFDYYYQLPSDALGELRAVYDTATCDRAFTDFRILQNRMATNAQAVWAEYIIQVPPQAWPGYFRELFIKALMSEFALSVAVDVAMHTRLAEQVYGPPHMLGEGGLLGEAKIRNSQGKPSRTLDHGPNPLVDVRRTRSGKRYAGM